MSERIERVPHPMPVPLSLATAVASFVFLSGQLALDEQGQLMGDDITSQTRIALQRIASILQGIGLTMGHVVKSTVWLADLKDFAAFNGEYRKHFDTGYPTRSTVQAQLFRDARVEIEVQAWRG